ncbi:unnamed protein product [Darwinula stevensoni]|uniref:Uncharacterized protein n=1 Tax=Darwinula stevensoni TaxID=69355 RepID=A0A7R9AHC8_9CRUS|nr:unnamed protein product [Darwinula stevensoni]CAG0904785.1 unnamed protein product [Darwinula stevensoni]
MDLENLKQRLETVIFDATETDGDDPAVRSAFCKQLAEEIHAEAVSSIQRSLENNSNDASDASKEIYLSKLEEVLSQRSAFPSAVIQHRRDGLHKQRKALEAGKRQVKTPVKLTLPPHDFLMQKNPEQCLQVSGH